MEEGERFDGPRWETMRMLKKVEDFSEPSADRGSSSAQPEKIFSAWNLKAACEYNWNTVPPEC